MIRLLRQGVRFLFRRSRLDDDIRREMTFHLEREIEQRVARGMAPEEARRTALRDFGGVERVRAEVQDVRGITVWDQFGQDLRFGVRTLSRSPGYTLAAVLILALGIGANTAIFSVIDGVLLKPLPFRDSRHLVLIQESAPASNILRTGVAIPELWDYRARLQSVTDLVEYHQMNFTLLKQGDPNRVNTGVVSANFFEMLGVRPILGRDFTTADEQLGADAVLILSNEYWRAKFGGDPSVIGRVLEMNNKPHTVIGVLPSFPQYPQKNDVYMPTSACPFRAAAQKSLSRGHRTFSALSVFGRLASGATEARASSEVAAVAASFATDHPEDYTRAKGLTGVVHSLQDQLVVGARPMLFALAGTTMLVLLITCANVANLALARTVRRSREMAVRTALGAGRGRLFRQLITESLVVAVGGGAAGVAVAWAALGMLTSFVGRFTPWTDQIAIDGGVLAFTAATAVVTGVLFGVAPALSVRRNVAEAVRDGGAQGGEGRGRHRLRSALVVAQVAVAFVLVVGAGLLLESLARLSAVPLGFDTRSVITADLSGNFSKFTSQDDSNRLESDILSRVRGLPGVRAAAFTSSVPLSNITPGQQAVLIDGAASTNARSFLVDPNIGGDGYFETLDVPLLHGRSFRPGDMPDQPLVAVVNASMAKLWDGADPVGRRFKQAGPPPPGQTEFPWLTVVGVVPDFHLYGADGVVGPQYYIPFTQSGTPLTLGGPPRLLVRVDRPGDLPATALKQAVYSVDAQIPVENVQTLEQLQTGRLASPALTAALLSTFAGIALLVTLAGIAGVIGTSVSQRTREFGLRTALGASRFSVMRLVLGQGTALVLVGVAMGVGGAVLFSRLIKSYLFATPSTDPLVYGAVGAIFLVAALLSIAGPARRATTIDPLTALRSE
jgi:predicted permease